ncbi:MAG: hypothetical protein LBS69_00200 [Prevotellaceae bacterium]|jgi:hypothetical protein|nr:hypothetical protein [Prevotellaceae bacterium]
MEKNRKKTGIDLRAPSGWGELTAEQTVTVAGLLGEGLSSAEELALLCFFRFTGVSFYRRNMTNYELRQRQKTGLRTDFSGLYRYKKYIVEIDDDTIFAFAEKLKFLADVPGLMACQNTIAGLHFSDSELWQTTFEEYCMADRYYRAYSKMKDENHLCAMIAALYRNKKEAYRDELVEKNTKRILRKSQPEQRQAVFLWWTGLKVWIREKYPDLFSGGKNTVEFGNTESDDDDSESIMNMLYSITEGKAHENRQVFKTSVHEVLHALNTKAKNINEMNSKFKKNN